MSLDINASEYDTYMKFVERVYTFVMCSMDAYTKQHDYGEGQVLSMVEMHTLAMIADTPGLRVTDVAKMWNRTLGAATKNINKLEKKGYVIKKKLPGNNKSIHLYPTEKGLHLAKLHQAYDKNNHEKTLHQLLEKHSTEELLAFGSVLESLIEINSGSA